MAVLRTLTVMTDGWTDEEKFHLGKEKKERLVSVYPLALSNKRPTRGVSECRKRAAVRKKKKKD